jgi:hypothetical protein
MYYSGEAYVEHRPAPSESVPRYIFNQNHIIWFKRLYLVVMEYSLRIWAAYRPSPRIWNAKV